MIAPLDVSQADFMCYAAMQLHCSVQVSVTVQGRPSFSHSALREQMRRRTKLFHLPQPRRGVRLVMIMVLTLVDQDICRCF